MTPPNPRLFNPRLLEDYIDWYMNVYLEEEELPWQWVGKPRLFAFNIFILNSLLYPFQISVGNAAERKRQSEEEAIDEATKLSSTSSTPQQKQ